MSSHNLLVATRGKGKREHGREGVGVGEGCVRCVGYVCAGAR